MKDSDHPSKYFPQIFEVSIRNFVLQGQACTVAVAYNLSVQVLPTIGNVWEFGGRQS